MNPDRDQNSGAIFKNNKKTTESQPNAKGEALIDGVEYWISAWTNTSKKGELYQKLKFNRKEPTANTNASTTHTANSNTPNNLFNSNFSFDQDMPF